MNKREELDLFLERAGELIDSTYILADVKIANLLKSIASSDTLMAIFQNCLAGFDYSGAKKKYLIPNGDFLDKGEFVLPSNSRELLALIFTLLVDVDAGRIALGEFINKYFFEDGSYSLGYASFLNSMIKPFKNSVKMLMESVIDGKLQDPVEALVEQEERLAKEKAEAEQNKIKEQELSQKVYGESVKKVKAYLLEDKKKIKESKLSDEQKQEMILIIDVLANTVDQEDKDAIEYAFVSYKYLAKAKKFLFRGRAKKMTAEIRTIINGI
ncbi:MAG: hypothetical protein IJC07_02155 [Clostridia bacterium]|nr:hypothetical protein [Clostridia bacterium]